MKYVLLIYVCVCVCVFSSIRFDAIVSADAFENLKPAPDIFLAASTILNVPISEVYCHILLTFFLREKNYFVSKEIMGNWPLMSCNFVKIGGKVLCSWLY